MTVSATTPPPWYRQAWPWLLISGPAIVVVAGFYTLWLAISSDDGLVADDYYKQGLGINRVLERTERAAALGITATVDVDAQGAARVVLASTNADDASLPTALKLAIVHPTRAGLDRHVDLVRGPDGAYVGKMAPIPAGRWLVNVETPTWRLPVAEVAPGVQDVHLTAAAAR